MKASSSNNYNNWFQPLVHLEHEIYLLVSLSFLMVASFQSLYNDNFGLRGDFIFLAVTLLWLARYTLFRWLCVSDTATSSNPTLLGCLAHFATSHIYSGQYFDRMSPQKAIGGANNARVDAVEDFTGLFQYGSFHYAWNLICIKIIFPLQRKREEFQKSMLLSKLRSSSSRQRSSTTNANNSQSSSTNNNKRKGADTSNRSSSANSSLNKFARSWNRMYSSLESVIQASLPVCALIYFTWRLPFAKFLNFQNNDDGDNNSRGEDDGWMDVIFLVSVPIMLPLILFSRLINPIADLVAGSNVLKAVRNEAKAYGGISSKSLKSKVQVHETPQQMCSWAEQNKSIISQPRLRLFLTVGLLRILENLYLVSILPWTGYVCRATAHCHDGIQLWQLSSVLFPAGITTTLRVDANTSNEFDFDPDYLSAFITTGSVVAVSFILLLSQAVALNGSYLAITGYVCGEWIEVDIQKEPTVKTASQWDARRRYKKGDIVAIKSWGRTVFYKASSNSPEGRPFNKLLRSTHEIFSRELGHPSTSGLLTATIKVHLLFIAIFVLIVMVNTLISGNNSNGMLSALVGNIVGCYGAINAGMRNRKELQHLNEDIRRQIPLYG